MSHYHYMQFKWFPAFSPKLCYLVYSMQQPIRPRTKELWVVTSGRLNDARLRTIEKFHFIFKGCVQMKVTILVFKVIKKHRLPVPETRQTERNTQKHTCSCISVAAQSSHTKEAQQNVIDGDSTKYLWDCVILLISLQFFKHKMPIRFHDITDCLLQGKCQLT